MQEPNPRRKYRLITLSLVIFGTLFYGFAVFQFDYFEKLKRGDSGKVAIQALDEMRRPFLTLKKAELRLLQATDTTVAISAFESAMHEGRLTLSEYDKVASYNEELRTEVAELKSSYEAWLLLELELLSKKTALTADPDNSAVHHELDILAQKNVEGFLAVMEVLGHGEKPIHDDIDTGAEAGRGLLASSLAFIAYLTGVAFRHEWARHRSETLRYESELELHRLAYKDSLTGLPNRLLLEDRFSVAIADARRYGHHVGVLYLDLDGFKRINDEMGHDQGDTVLKEMALRLQQNTRAVDTVARVGGDEFVILLTKLQDPAGVQLTADKLQTALSKPLELKGKTYLAGASIGVAIFPDDGEQPDQLLKKADAAMYKAKATVKTTDATLRIEAGTQHLRG
jgi:diguanylate cyclase (GGDEF)-like protein